MIIRRGSEILDTMHVQEKTQQDTIADLSDRVRRIESLGGSEIGERIEVSSIVFVSSDDNTKKFRLSINNAGYLSATEVLDNSTNNTNEVSSMILISSEDSNKKFMITINNDGYLIATEIEE